MFSSSTSTFAVCSPEWPMLQRWVAFPSRQIAAMSYRSEMSPAEVSDRDAGIMARIARSDQAALGELYDLYHRVLYGVALGVLRDPAEAEDIVHDAFVVVWQKAAEFDARRGNTFSWIVTLVRNRAIDRIRMRRRRGELLEQAAAQDLPHPDGADDPDAAESTLLIERATAVRDAVNRLPAEQRDALQLAFFGGLTQIEIAERLQAPLGTVKARIRRGLLRLRDFLVTPS